MIFMITPEQIAQAAAILEQGGLVAFPTETVYGLGADAENPQAVARIYQAKGRPASHPVIVHLSPEAKLEHWAASVPAQARQLIQAFWPGPLTLILPRAAHIPDAVSGGQDSIGVRCPAHPVAQALLRAFRNGQGGIAAPSANRFGRVSPTTAQHVREEFAAQLEPGGLIGMVLEGGQSEVGIESTIVDLTRLDSVGPVLLRPGQISIEQLATVLGQRPRTAQQVASATATTPRVSGSLDSHYAPHTPVAIVPRARLDQVLDQLAQAGKKVALMHIGPLSTNVLAPLCMPAKAAPYAFELYASLRNLDQSGADLIVVQAPPEGEDWHGVRDRLTRAAHDSIGILQRMLDAPGS